MANPDIRGFLIRRAARILPLAWLTLTIVLVATGAPLREFASEFLMIANFPGFHLAREVVHFWSLCVEVQFYVGVAILVLLLGRSGLYVLVGLCLAVTLNRVASGAHLASITWLRVDEILAGCILALIHGGWFGNRPQRWLTWLHPYLLAPVLVASAHAEAGPLNYLRPYIAMLLVGSTLRSAPAWLALVLESRVMAYVAKISFALYVVHGVLMETWLATGERFVKYAKRPLLIAASFALAHVSTFRFENYFIALGHRLAARPRVLAAGADDMSRRPAREL
jgi:peptidoglycan/LPS O-acetylase OafA/YrhL